MKTATIRHRPAASSGGVSRQELRRKFMDFSSFSSYRVCRSGEVAPRAPPSSESAMRAFVRQRETAFVNRLPACFLLLIALLILPAALPAGDPLFRVVDSLASPAFVADLAGTLAQPAHAKERLPATVFAESPVYASLPNAWQTCRAPLLPEAAHRPPSFRLSTPSLPRPPPLS